VRLGNSNLEKKESDSFVAQMRGKLRRIYLVYARPGYVREQEARRKGECARCGACCVLAFRCPFYDAAAEPPSCRIHERRPRVCRCFAIDERDIRDRDRVLPERRCGFSFE
jgi:hypothetical protein